MSRIKYNDPQYTINGYMNESTIADMILTCTLYRNRKRAPLRKDSKDSTPWSCDAFGFEGHRTPPSPPSITPRKCNRDLAIDGTGEDRSARSTEFTRFTHRAGRRRFVMVRLSMLGMASSKFQTSGGSSLVCTPLQGSPGGLSSSHGPRLAVAGPVGLAIHVQTTVVHLVDSAG